MKHKLFLLSLAAIILSGCGGQASSVDVVSSTEEKSSVEETSVVSSSLASSVEESNQEIVSSDMEESSTLESSVEESNQEIVSSDVEESSTLESSVEESNQEIVSSDVEESSTLESSVEESNQEIVSSDMEESSTLESSVEESNQEIVSSDMEESSTLASSVEEDMPAYYQNKGLDLNATGATLKTQLFDIIKSPQVTSYAGLYTAYLSTDVKYEDDQGKKHLWDMYSSCDYLMPDDEKHSNSAKEGDNYNREHTIPQSIFSKKSPMVSDVFHVYPTDSFVNGKRSDYPHAEVSTASYTSSNGTKVGTSATNNVSGTVCEPADEYKGDFARTYFYFVTCYQDKLSGFSNFSTFSKNTYPSLATWAIQLYKQWSDDDPVSQKEIDRNEAGYAIQGNRNPFIDFPNLEDKVWNNY